jgi:hypothetical protein
MKCEDYTIRGGIGAMTFSGTIFLVNMYGLPCYRIRFTLHQAKSNPSSLSLFDRCLFPFLKFYPVNILCSFPVPIFLFCVPKHILKANGQSRLILLSWLAKSKREPRLPVSVPPIRPGRKKPCERLTKLPELSSHEWNSRSKRPRQWNCRRQ